MNEYENLTDEETHSKVSNSKAVLDSLNTGDSCEVSFGLYIRLIIFLDYDIIKDTNFKLVGMGKLVDSGESYYSFRRL